MKDIIVYINDELVDLNPGTIIAPTIEVADVSSLSSRSVGYTNSVTFPNTPKNRKIFGFIHDEHSASRYANMRFRCHVVDGGERTFDGFFYVTDIDEGYSGNIYDKTIEFFDLLGEKELTELTIDDLGPAVFGRDEYWMKEWDYVGKHARRVSTGGVVIPAINYGQINVALATFDLGAIIPPSVYYHTVIEKIIEEAGYTPEGEVFDLDEYKNLVIPFSRDNFDFGKQFIRERSCHAYKVTDQIIAGATSAFITFDSYETPGTRTNIFNLAPVAPTSQYVSIGNGDTRKSIFAVYAKVTFTVTSGTYRFVLFAQDGASFVNNGNVYSDYYGAGTHSIFIKRDDNLTAFGGSPIICDGYSLKIGHGVAGAVTVHTAELWVKVEGHNCEAIDPHFLTQDILPDMTQKELFDDFAVRFGLLFETTTDKILKCIRIEDILKKKYGVTDWSKKYIAGSQTTSFSNSYARKNIFAADVADDLYQEGSGDGEMLIDNVNLEVERVVHQSQFCGTVNQSMTNSSDEVIDFPQIICWDAIPTNYDDYVYKFKWDTSPGLRLLSVKLNTSAISVKIDSFNNSTDWLLARFIDQPTGADFQSAVDNNYAMFSRALDMSRFITRLYDLKPIDIKNFNKFSVLFDNNAYYLVRNINEFVNGEPTEVQLFKTI